MESGTVKKKDSPSEVSSEVIKSPVQTSATETSAKEDDDDEEDQVMV